MSVQRMYRRIKAIAHAQDFTDFNRARQSTLLNESEKVAENTRKSINALKVGTMWMGRGSHRTIAIIEKIDGSSIWYRTQKGLLKEMSADYFVYWYKLKG